MASLSVAPPRPPAELPPEPHVDVIDKRIRQTRWQLKLNDFATALIALVAGVLAYLLAGALADHWLVPGGLGFTSRLVLFVGLVGGAGWYCLRVLLPPLIYHVNPIYAAKTLEQARPSLKNSLINLLLLRREGTTGGGSPLAERVIEGLRETTADQLDQIPAEVAVDRIHLIRRGYVLVGLVALAAGYLVFSPKNPMPSFGRVLWPWARIAAPSRVRIEQLTPGNATVFQGRSVTVSAVVEGLRSGEEVFLHYSTDDGQIVEQAIPMTPGQGHSQYECQVPPTKAGLQQSLCYRLAAGDSTTLDYRLSMEVPPTIVVDSVRYTYPKYTDLPERIVKDSADIRAIEGTRIGLEATANREIQWAGIEFSGQADQRVRMRTAGKRALGEFLLELKQDEQSPRWYQIRFAESETGESRENIDPVRHRIEVFADRAPQVRLVDPPADKATLPLDGLADLNVEASDPDFALARVAILAQRNAQPLPIPLLLDRTDTGRAYEGQYKTTYQFEPGKLGLRVGDEVQYQAVAEDNKEPQRNRTETEPRWLKIGPPEGSEPQRSQDPAEGGKPTSQGAQQHRPGEEPKDSNEGDKENQPQDPGVNSEQNNPNPTAEQGDQGSQLEQQQPGDKGEGEAGEPVKQQGETGSASQSKDPQGQGEEGQKSGDDAEKGTQEGQKGDQAKQEGQKGGEAGQEGQKGGEAGPEGNNPQQSLDPEAPGDVFEQVLKQRDKEARESRQNPESSGTAEAESDSQPGQQSKPGAGEPSGEPKAGDKSDDAKEDPGQSNVPPNRMEQGGKEGEEESPTSPQEMGGEGQPSPAAANENQTQSPETESNATGGKPTGKPGKGETPKETETVDGGKAKPEDLENGTVESIERKPHDPATGNEPEQSAKPQPGSPKPGDPAGGDPAQRPEDAQPSPMPQGANQPNAEKPNGGRPADQQAKPEVQSPSISKKQSDQDQREPADGDQSGNGGKGGGQDSDRQGLGNPGRSTPDEEGGQSGGQQGEGETGPEPGDKVPTDQPTGSQARQSGGKRQGEGDSPGESTGQKSQRDPQRAPGQSPPTDQPNERAGGAPGNNPAQRGDAEPESGEAGGSGVGPASGADRSETLGAEAANKEYAEKATDLALEYIEDQLNKSEPNQELLDRLGWTRQDLEAFFRRWQKMKADAKEAGPSGQEARQELDDALKSLGLRPTRPSVQGGRVGADKILKTESIRSTAPPAWRELTQEYTKSISSGEK